MGRKSYIFRFQKNETSEDIPYIVTATTTGGTSITTTFTITQKGAEVKSFEWSNGQTAITKDNVAYNSMTVNENYTTNYNLNELRITCDVDGCTGRLDSSGVFVASLTPNSGDTERTIVYTVTYKGTSVGVITIKQERKPEEKYFWIGESGKTTYTTPELDATAMSVNVSYITNYTQEELNELTSGTSFDWIKMLVLNNGIVNIMIDSNETTIPKNGYVHIVKNGYINVATINIKQKAVEKKFEWENSEETYKDRLIVSAETLNVSEKYTTNYTNLTLSYTNNVNNAFLDLENNKVDVVLNENTLESEVSSNVIVYSNGRSIGLLTIWQKAAEKPDFWINESGTSAYTIDMFRSEESYVDPPYSVKIITNYKHEDVNFEYGGFLNTVELTTNLDYVLFTFDENVGVERTAKITFYTGTTLTDKNTIGTISLSQEGVKPKYFYWIKGTSSATTIQVETEATATSCETKYITNYPNLSLTSEYYGNVVTEFVPESITATTDTPETLTVKFTENVSTTMNQVDTVYVNNGNTPVGYINLLQYPKGSINDWFKWVINGDATYNVPGKVSKDGYEINFEFQTNIEGISFYCEHMDWFDEGEVPSVKEDGGKYYCVGKLKANDDVEVHNVIILARNGVDTVGKLTLKQEAKPVEKYIWIEEIGTSAVTYEAPYTQTTKQYNIITNYTVTELGHLVSGITPSETNWIKNVELGRENLKFVVEKNENKKEGYFYVGNSIEEATSTLYTYEEVIGTGDTSNKYAFYKTNYPEETQFRIEKDPMFSNAIINTDGSIVFSLKENVENDDYFYFGNGDVSATTSGCTAISAATEFSCTYTTTYETISANVTENWVTVIVNNDGSFSGSLTENNTGNDRTALIALYADNDISNVVGNFYVTQMSENIEPVDEDRSCVLSFYSGSVKVIEVTVNQEANDERSFKWTSELGPITADTAITVTSESGDSEGINVMVTYETDYDNLRVDTEQYSWIKDATVDVINNAVKYHLDKYSDTSYSPLRGEIKLYGNNKLIGRIVVIQEPAPEPDKYFIFKYNGEEITTSTLEITGVPATLTEQTQQFKVSALTNYQASVFTLEVDSSAGGGWLTNVSKGDVDTTGFTVTFNVANNIGDERTGYIYIKKTGSIYRTIKLVQKAMTYEFSWEQGSVVTTKIIGPLGTGATSDNVPFYSNYPNIQVSGASQSGMTCSIIGTNARYTTSQRGATEYEEKSVTFVLTSNDREIGSLTIKQQGQVSPLTFKWDNGSNYKEVIINYERKSFSETYTVSPEGVYTLYVFPDTTNPNGFAPTEKTYVFSSGVNFTANTYDIEANTVRTGRFYIKGSTTGEVTYDSPTYATFVIKQTPKPYFYWGTGTETATTMTIPVTGTPNAGQSVLYRTNYSSLTADNVSVDSGFLARNFGNNKFVIFANENTNIKEREQTFKIYNGDEEVGRITVTQQGASPVFKWNDNNDTALTIDNITVAGENIEKSYINNYLNVQLVTAGMPSWITNAKVNSTTGNSEFSCTIGSSDEITARTYTFTICGQTNNYSSSRQIIGTITVSQAAATPRFKWVNSQQVNDSGSTTDTGISWSTEYYYDTNYSGITCSVSSDPNTLVSSASVNRSDGSGYLHILTKTNDTQNSKVCIIDIKSNGSTLGQFSFEQAAPNPYFAWGSSTGPNSTAITVSTSSQAANKSYYTNYTGLTITFSSGDDLLQASSLTSSLFSVTASTNQETRERSGVYNVKGKWNGSESNIGSITVKQAAAASWFTWSNGDTADTIENIPAAGSSFSEGYLTNDSNPTTTYTLSANTTLTPNVGWGANNTVTGNVSEYTVITDTGRTLTVYVKKGTTRVATLTIKQLPATGVFEWVAGGSLGSITSDKKSATTTTLGSGIVNFVANFNTNYSSLSATKQNDQISPTNTGCSVTYSVLSGKTSENATTNQRSVEFIVKNGSTELGYLKVVQAASSPYFQWSNGETAMTVNIKSGATIASANCSSNMSSLGAVHKSGTSYISSPSVTTSKFTASTTANNTMNDRTETFNIYSGSSTSNVVGEITFIQAAGPYISWDSSSIVTTSSTTKYAAAASTSDITINYYTNISSTTAIKLSGSVSSSSSILSSSAISTTNKTITFRLKENTSTADRSETIYIYSGSSYSKHYLCELTINQAGASTPPTPTTRTLTINAANNFKFEVQGYAPFQDDEVEYLIATANSTSVGDAINFYGKLVTGTSVTFNTSGSITLNNQPTSQVTVTLYVVPYRGERTMHLVGYGWMDGVSFYSNHSTVTSGNNSFSVTFNAGTNSITLESRNPNGEIKNT